MATRSSNTPCCRCDWERAKFDVQITSTQVANGSQIQEIPDFPNNNNINPRITLASMHTLLAIKNSSAILTRTTNTGGRTIEREEIHL